MVGPCNILVSQHFRVISALCHCDPATPYPRVNIRAHCCNRYIRSLSKPSHLSFRPGQAVLRLLRAKHHLGRRVPDNFEHTPLTERSHIRLLWLEPGKDGDVISLTLFESLLQPSPWYLRLWRSLFLTDARPRYHDFDALSYVWGDPNNKREVLVSGAKFPITINLLEFFNQMRHATLRRGPYWVDAICIDQSNSIEKSVQVSMMSEIYGNAREGLMWLGPEADDSNVAFDLFEAFEKAAFDLYEDRNKYPQWLTWYNDMPDTANVEVIAFLSIMRNQARLYLLERIEDNFGFSPDFLSLAWPAMVQIWNRPWFQRIWTIQEFTLPKKVWVLCGPRRLDASTLIIFHYAYTFSLTVHDQRKLGIDGLDPNNNGRDSFVSAVTERLGFEVWRHENHRYKLLNEARDNRHRLASDDRDKIYGLMGIASDAYRPDYTRSTYEVYLDFAVRCIRQGGQREHLQLLSESGYPRAIVDLPSWVPDWSVVALPKPLHFDSDLYQGVFGPSFDYEMPRISDDQKTLVCRGVVFDTVKDTEVYTDGLANAIPEIVHSWKEERRAHMNSVFENEMSTYVEALPLPVTSKDIDSYLDGLVFETLVGDSFVVEGKRLRFEALDVEQFKLSTSNNYALGRVIFTTEDGQLGLGPLHSEAGDLVVALTCVKLPFILRRKDSYFEMIGPCYVSGFMDGDGKVTPQEVKELEIR